MVNCLFQEQEANRLLYPEDIIIITKFAGLGLCVYFQAPLHASALHSGACFVILFVLILYVCCES